MKLKRSLALLLTLAMVITSVSVPETSKKASAEVSWGETAVTQGDIVTTGDLPSSRVKVPVTIKVPAAAMTTDNFSELSEITPADGLDFSITVENSDDETVEEVFKDGDDYVNVKTTTINSTNSESSIDLYLPQNDTYHLVIKYKNHGAGDTYNSQYPTTPKSPLDKPEIKTYVTSLVGLDDDNAVSVNVEMGQTSRKLGGTIVGLDPAKSYTLTVAATSKANADPASFDVTIPANSRNYALSNIDLATEYGTYTEASDRITLTLKADAETVKVDGNNTNTIRVTWKEMKFATLTASQVGQSYVVISAATDKSFAGIGQKLQYAISTTSSSVYVDAKANAGAERFTEDNADYVNYTRIPNLLPDTEYKVRLIGNGTNYSQEITFKTLPRNDAEIAKTNADGTPGIFDPVLYDRLLMEMKAEKIVSETEIKEGKEVDTAAFSALDVEKLLNKTNGKLNLGLPVNSQKKALTALTGLENVGGIMEIDLANNNLTSAAFTDAVLGALVFVSKINLQKNELTEIPNFTTLANLGNPSKTDNVDLSKNIIPATAFTKEALAQKFEAKVLAKVQTEKGWSRFAKTALSQRVKLDPTVDAGGKYTAFGDTRPLIVKVSNLPKPVRSDALKLVYYLTIKKGDTIIKEEVFTPNAGGKKTFTYTDISKDILTDGDNVLTFTVEPKNANYKAATVTQTVTYDTSVAAIKVDEVRYGSIVVSGGVATNAAIVGRSGAFNLTGKDSLVLQVSTNKKFRYKDEENVQDENGVLITNKDGVVTENVVFEGLTPNTKYFVRLSAKLNGVTYPLTDAVSFTTKKANVKVKASKIKKTKGYNRNRLQSDITVTLPKKGNIIVEDVEAGVYSNRGYATADLSKKAWHNKYHLNAYVPADSKQNYNKVYAYVYLRDLDTGDGFVVFMGDVNSKGLTAYKKIKGTLKVKENTAYKTKFKGTIKNSALNNDLNVYLRVTSGSALITVAGDRSISYANGKYTTVVDGVKANSTYQATLYVEKPDGTEKVLKEISYTTPVEPVTVTAGDFNVTPGVANAVATIAVKTAVPEKDYAITDVTADIAVSYKENPKKDEIDTVTVGLDDNEITKADDGTYTITAPFSANVYPDKENAASVAGQPNDLFRVYMQPKVTVTYTNMRTNKSGEIVLDSFGRKSADKLTKYDTLTTVTLSPVKGVKDGENTLNLTAQFSYNTPEGAVYTGKSLANIGNMINYRLNVYDKANPDNVMVVSKSALGSVDNGTLKIYTDREGLSGSKANGDYIFFDFNPAYEEGAAAKTYVFQMEKVADDGQVTPMGNPAEVTYDPTPKPTDPPSPEAPVALDSVIPDANFRAYIQDHYGYGLEEGKTNVVISTFVNKTYVTDLYLDVSPYAEKKIASLEGIEKLFPNLRTIDLTGNTGITNYGGLTTIDTLYRVNLSYTGLTAKPAIFTRYEGLTVDYTGNSIPGEANQLAPAALTMEDVYYAVNDDKDGDIEKIDSTYPTYFEVTGFSAYANYKITYGYGDNTYTDEIPYGALGTYEYYGENGSAFNDKMNELIKAETIKLDTPVEIFVKVEKQTTADGTFETELDVKKNIVFSAEKVFTDSVVKEAVISQSDNTYHGKIYLPGTTLIENIEEYIGEKDDYDYDKYEGIKKIDWTLYEGSSDNDTGDKYLDNEDKDNGKEFLYGNQEKQGDVALDTDEAVIKLYLVDEAGKQVAKSDASLADCDVIDTYEISPYVVNKYKNDKDDVAEELGASKELATTIDFTFDNYRKQITNLAPGTYTLQYVMPNGTAGSVTQKVVKAKAAPVERKASVRELVNNSVRPDDSKTLDIQLSGSYYDFTKVTPVINQKVGGAFTPVGTLKGSKANTFNDGSTITTTYTFTNDAGWKEGQYYVSLNVQDGYTVEKKGKCAQYDYLSLYIDKPETALVLEKEGFNKDSQTWYAKYTNMPAGATVTAKLYKYANNDKYNQYVEGEATPTVTSEGAISLSFAKDNVPVVYEYGVDYKVVYNILNADGTVARKDTIEATPHQQTFDYTRVMDNENYSGMTYYITNGSKKVNLNAYMTTALVKGKKVTAQLVDQDGYNVGTAVKMKLTKVKNTDYTKVSGTFNQKKLKLSYGRYTVRYYVAGDDVADEYNYSNTSFDEIYVVDLQSEDYYQIGFDSAASARSADGTIKLTVNTLHAKNLKAKKFALEITNDDDEVIADAKTKVKIKPAKNQVTFTITGIPADESATVKVKYNKKYALNYVEENYARGAIIFNPYNDIYMVGVPVINGKKKSTTVTVRATTAGAVLRLYDKATTTEVKAVSIDAVGVYTLKAADLAGLDLGVPYDWTITDYAGVARHVGSSYFYAQTAVVKTAAGVETAITGIRTAAGGKKLNISVGESFALNAYATPARTTDTPVKYKLAKKGKKVIKLTKAGVIKAKKAGKAVITITSTQKKKVKMKLTVIVGPKATKITKVKANKNGTVTVKWKKAKSSKKAKVKGYIIYASQKEDGTYKQVAKVGAKKTSAKVKKGLKAKKTYYFKIAPFAKAKKAVLEGSKSKASKKVTVKKAKKAKKKASKKKSTKKKK